VQKYTFIPEEHSSYDFFFAKTVKEVMTKDQKYFLD